MYINKSIINKIKLFGFALSLVFSFMLLSPVETNAQTRRQVRVQDRRDAALEGYRRGLREGPEDARNGRRRNARGENSYRGANGHNSRSEIQAYRAAFIRGYNEGYNRYMRENGRY